MEPGEGITDALSRELREETRLEVGTLRLVGVYSNPGLQVITYPDGRRTRFVTGLFAGTVQNTSIVGSDEGRDWGWFCHLRSFSQPLRAYVRLRLDDAFRVRATSSSDERPAALWSSCGSFLGLAAASC